MDLRGVMLQQTNQVVYNVMTVQTHVYAVQFRVVKRLGFVHLAMDKELCTRTSRVRNSAASAASGSS